MPTGIICEKCGTILKNSAINCPVCGKEVVKKAGFLEDYPENPQDFHKWVNKMYGNSAPSKTI